MELVLKNKTEFVTRFVKPISNITDTGIVKIQDNQISCITSTPDGLILYASGNIDVSTGKTIILNCPDLKRLERILSLLSTETVELNYTGNSLTYNDKKTRFTYHLLENGILNGPSLSVDKIAKLEFPVKVSVLSSKIGELIKGASFANMAQKVYLTIEEQSLIGEIADRNNPLIDTYTTELAENVSSTESISDLPVNFEVFRVISGLYKYEQVTININTQLGVLMFEIGDGNYKLKYIVSALVS